MSMQQSLEQKRAAAAWACVENVKKNGRNKKGEGFAKDYGALAKDAPAYIQSNGLGQTLAFWYAKGFEKGAPQQGNNEHAQLFRDVSQWVGKQIKGDENLNLLDWVVKVADTNDYRRATVEAIAFLIWLKRFVEAELSEDKGI